MKKVRLLFVVILTVVMALGLLAPSVSEVEAQALPPTYQAPACKVVEGESIHLGGRAGEEIPISLQAVSENRGGCVWTVGKPAKFGSLEMQANVNELQASYRPDPDYEGMDEFELLVDDLLGLPSRVKVFVDIMPVRQPRILEHETVDENQSTWLQSKPLSGDQLNADGPFIVARPNEDRIEGLSWPVETTFVITIGSNIWSGTTNINGYFDIDTIGYDLVGGSVISVTAGSQSLTYTVSMVKVTGVDPDTNIVSGTSTTGDQIVNEVYSPTWFRHPDGAITDSVGNWSIDFTGKLDLVPGMRGQAFHYEGSNFTIYNWVLRKPILEVNLTKNYVVSDDWEPIVDVTLTMGLSSWTKKTNDNGWVWFNVDTKIDPNMTLSMTNGTATITHKVIDLKVISIDPDTNVVSGSAEAGIVYPAACSPNPGGGSNCYSWLPVEVASDLTWSADFNGKIDIKPRSHGWVIQRDTYGNGTQVDWKLPVPWMEVNVTENSLDGYDLPANAPVQLTIDGVEKGKRTSNASGEVSFYLNNFDVKADQTITLTSGLVSLSYKVQKITVDSINIDSNMVSGKGDPEDSVWVNACSSSSCGWNASSLMANTEGNWSYDFTGLVDLDKTTWGRAYQEDANGNQTWFRWFVPNPIMDVYPMSDLINGYQFKPGGEVNISIGSLSWKATASESGWFGLRTSGHDLVVGDKVIMTQGDLTIDHTVIDLQVTDINVDTNVISGKGLANKVCTLWSYDSFYWETTAMSDGNGNWTKDLTGIYDVKPGSDGSVYQSDDEGDSTIINWYVPNPSFVVYPDYEEISVFDWPANEELKITIGARSWDLTVGSNGWGYLGLDGFDIQAGQVVTVAGSQKTKTHTVIDLTVTAIDVEADVVTGHGAANSAVYVVFFPVPGQGGYGTNIMSDTNGNWKADFSNWTDILPGSLGYVRQADDDGDSTEVGWATETLVYLPMIRR